LRALQNSVCFACVATSVEVKLKTVFRKHEHEADLRTNASILSQNKLPTQLHISQINPCAVSILYLMTRKASMMPQTQDRDR
jgi:hypothetical protein